MGCHHMSIVVLFVISNIFVSHVFCSDDPKATNPKDKDTKNITIATEKVKTIAIQNRTLTITYGGSGSYEVLDCWSYFNGRQIAVHDSLGYSSLVHIRTEAGCRCRGTAAHIFGWSWYHNSNQGSVQLPIRTSMKLDMWTGNEYEWVRVRPGGDAYSWISDEFYVSRLCDPSYEYDRLPIRGFTFDLGIQFQVDCRIAPDYYDIICRQYD